MIVTCITEWDGGGPGRGIPLVARVVAQPRPRPAGAPGAYESKSIVTSSLTGNVWHVSTKFAATSASSRA